MAAPESSGSSRRKPRTAKRPKGSATAPPVGELALVSVLKDDGNIAPTTAIARTTGFMGVELKHHGVLLALVAIGACGAGGPPDGHEMSIGIGYADSEQPARLLIAREAIFDGMWSYRGPKNFTDGRIVQ